MKVSPSSFLMLAATALVLAALLALAVAPPLMDWNRHRPALAEYLSRALGEPVALGGDISLRLLPVPSLQAETVSLGDSVEIEALRLQADWLALLAGGLQAGTARAGRLEAHLLRRAGEQWRLPLHPLAVDSIEIEAGSLLLHDEALGLRQEIGFAEARLQGGAGFLQSGRATARLTIPGLPAGEEAELRLALDGADVSLRIASPSHALRFQGRREGRSLRGTVEAHRRGADMQEIDLRAELLAEAGRAQLRQLTLQWGETHWSGGGDIAMLSGRPRLGLSLHTPTFEADAALGLLGALSGLLDGSAAAVMHRLDAQIALSADSLLWQGDSLASVEATARLDAHALALDIAAQQLRGGGSARWQAEAERSEAARSGDGLFAPLAGPARVQVQRPGLLLPALSLPAFLRQSAQLQGVFSWSPPRGRLGLDAAALTLADAPAAALTARLRLTRRALALESLDLDFEAQSLPHRIQASGDLFWPRPEGPRQENQGPEGRIQASLSAPDASVWWPALLPHDPLSLRAEWSFAPTAPDRFALAGDLGAARLHIQADGLARLLHQSETADASTASASLRASWRQPGGFAELDGALLRQEEFLRGNLRAGGDDARRLFAFWLPSLHADAPPQPPLPFALTAGLAASADGRNRRLTWQEMAFSLQHDPNEPLAVRGEGHIATGREGRPPFLQARLQGDALHLPGWAFLALPDDLAGASAAWMPELDIAADFRRAQIGGLAVQQAALRLSGAGGGVDALALDGRMFGGVLQARANLPSAATPQPAATRWQLGLRGARLEQASGFLWGREIASGEMDISVQASGDIRRPRTLSGQGTAMLGADSRLAVDAKAAAQPIDGLEETGLVGTVFVELGLQSGVLSLRGRGGDGLSLLRSELDLETLTGRLRAEFPVALHGRETALGYVVEGDLWRPQVSLDTTALEREQENLRLQKILQTLEEGDL